MAGLRGRYRIRSGAMSVDKAELCGSLFTWVGRGWGQGQVCARSSLPGARALVRFTFRPGAGRRKGGSRQLIGPLDSGPEHPPLSHRRSAWTEKVRSRPFVAGSRGARAQVMWFRPSLFARGLWDRGEVRPRPLRSQVSRGHSPRSWLAGATGQLMTNH